MKIKLSKSQWEDMGKKAGWTKTAAPVQPMQGQQPSQPTQPVQQKPQSSAYQIIDQNLRSLEMQSNALPLNGQKIRVLLGQIRQLAQTDPSIAA